MHRLKNTDGLNRGTVCMTWTDTQEQICQVEIMLFFSWTMVPKMVASLQLQSSRPCHSDLLGKTPIWKTQQNLTVLLLPLHHVHCPSLTAEPLGMQSKDSYENTVNIP